MRISGLLVPVNRGRDQSDTPNMIDVNVKTGKNSPGARASIETDFSDVDRVPVRALNEVIWRSVMGRNSALPVHDHRIRPIVDPNDLDRGDKDDKD